MIRILFIGIFCFVTIASKSQSITVTGVIFKIKQEINCPWNMVTVDKIKAGDPETKVTGIATTFMATLEVLKKAKEAGCNFIITHEPTFYSHTDDLVTHAGESIQEEKLKFIKENNLVVWRFHDHLHRNKPDMIYEGVVNKLGWKNYTSSDDYTYTIPPKSLNDIVADIQSKFHARTIRVIGNPDAIFSKVGMVLGAAGSGAHFKMLQNPGCELLIVGETNEWETVPYIQDAITLGQNKALIVLGHADSEEAGMEVCADWLKRLYPQVNIKFIEAGNPYWAGK
ncbi:MAG: Nif3-like dinuclear metal center hexameric protein [Saprospiraceae bacterium]